MPLRALAALSDKERERRKKNLIDNGSSSTLFSLGAASIRGHIFYTEIIASALLCMCFRVSVWQFGPHDHKPEVV